MAKNNNTKLKMNQQNHRGVSNAAPKHNKLL